MFELTPLDEGFFYEDRFIRVQSRILLATKPEVKMELRHIDLAEKEGLLELIDYLRLTKPEDLDAGYVQLRRQYQEKRNLGKREKFFVYTAKFERFSSYSEGQLALPVRGYEQYARNITEEVASSILVGAAVTATLTRDSL